MTVPFNGYGSFKTNIFETHELILPTGWLIANSMHIMRFIRFGRNDKTKKENGKNKK
jgi:hypothetical protein